MKNKLIIEGNFDNKVHTNKKMCDAFGNLIQLPDGYKFLDKISDGK